MVDHPGAQRPLALLAADDARRSPRAAASGWAASSESLAFITQSRRNVRREVLRAEDAGPLGVGVGAPGAAARRRVPSRPGSPASCVEHPPGRGHALLGQGVGDVGYDRVVGVQHVAGAVGGGGVHPRHPAAAVLRGAAGRGTSCALPMSRKVSMVRSCSALASRIAKKLVGVQRHQHVRGVEDVALRGCGRGPR